MRDTRRDDAHAEATERHPDAAVVVPPRSSAVPSDTAETAPTQRDAHLRFSAERALMGRQEASGCNRRALVGADTAQRGRAIAGDPRSRRGGRQATGAAIAVDVLNRTLDLGRPQQVQIA